MKCVSCTASVGLVSILLGTFVQPSTSAETPAVSCLSGELKNLARLFNKDRFHEMFPEALELYSFDGLISAANKFSAFANSGNDSTNTLELAAFLAQIAHETDSLKAAEEYARDDFSVWQYCDNTTVPCAPGRRYHGRGAIQISWNFNYNAAGKALGLDLLNNPDIVITNSTVAWMTALWYWMTPQKNGCVIHDVVTGVDGFALSTNIINGEFECGPEAINKENDLNRVVLFNGMCQELGVEALGKISCNA
ncbi:hypothetical protein CCR75_003009 [Bremia lactucae]|uniref:Glycoside hydrolase family 19 catalytic domain-containing protein n=1 Tax=Bremia lactucae TaxID=4779 RepID=A0A976FFB2_BRELC|nr:hypothetical protein CCR75_003009 [Bremia lactucae]